MSTLPMPPGQDPSDILAQRNAMRRTQMAQTQQAPMPQQVAQQQAASQGGSAPPQQQSRQPQRGPMPMPPTGNARLDVAKNNLNRAQNKYIPGIQQKLRDREYIAQAEKQYQADADAALAEQDEKYTNAMMLLQKTRPSLSDDEKDALAREYATGNAGLEYIIPELATEADLAKAQADYEKGLLDRDDKLKEQGQTIYNTVKDNIAVLEKLERNKRQLSDIKKAGYDSGATQIAALYTFIKGIDPESVVREGEVALARLGMSTIEDLDRAVQNVTDVGIISEDLYYALTELADNFIASNEMSNMAAIDRAYQRGQQWGVPDNYVFSGTVQDDVKRWRQDVQAEEAAAASPAQPAVTGPQGASTIDPDDDDAILGAYGG